MKADRGRLRCRMGHYCYEHDFVHGAEAEELRGKLEKLLAERHATVGIRDVQRVLDDVDARDSLAYLEGRPKRARQSKPAPRKRKAK